MKSYWKQNRLKRELEARLAEFDDNERTTGTKAKEKARKIVEDARRESEAVISDLRAMQLNVGANVKEHELIEARKRLEGAAPAEAKKKAVKAKAAPRPLQAGDEVKVLSYGQKGTLIEKVSDTGMDCSNWYFENETGPNLIWNISNLKKKNKLLSSTSVRGRDSYVKLELDLTRRTI